MSARNRNTTRSEEIRGVDKNLLEKYEKRFITILQNNEDDQFPMPIIAPNGNQEGRHRTLALHNVLQRILKKNERFTLYIDKVKIPVAIFTKIQDEH